MADRARYTGYRIGGGIAAILAAICLLWVVVVTFTASETVVPEVSVVTEGPGGDEARPLDILAARTRMQDQRQDFGPGPNADAPEDAYSDIELFMRQEVADGRQLVQEWRGNETSVRSMLNPPQRLEGVSSLPYQNATLLEQPGGRDWRSRRNDYIRYAGGWVLFGMLFILAAFLAFRGRVPIKEGESGETVQRFNTFERANHWMTATSFVLMGLTGLVIIYGRSVLLPLMGASAFGTLSWWSTWLHMAFAVPFTLGVLVMIVVWIKDNLPDRVDWPWLKTFGGMMSDNRETPPTKKFNAGQKLIFWAVVVGGLGLVWSGATLMLPYAYLGLDGMQATLLAHSTIAVVMIAVIFGHIYIGTVGMQGAFWAMWNGLVDRNWAREHHSIWYRRITVRNESENSAGAVRSHAEPAE